MEEWLELSKVSRNLPPEDVSKVISLCAALQEHLTFGATEFVRKHSTGVVFFSYASDCTLLRTRRYISGQGPSSQHRVQRQGSQSESYLMQRAVLRAWTPNGPETFILPYLPVCMNKGKTSWHLFACLKEHFRACLQSSTFPAISLTHYCFDRGVLNSLSQCAFQEHSHATESVRGTEAIVSDMLVSSGCCLHDVHNGLKWSMRSYFGSGALSYELHTLMRNLSRCLPGLCEVLPEYLAKHVSIREDAADEGSAHAFWVSIGIQADWVDAFVQINPRQEGSRLVLNPAGQGIDNYLEQVSGLMMHVFRFRTHCETRWLSLGPVVRCILVSHLLGVQHLLQYASEKGKIQTEVASACLKTIQRCDLIRFAMVCSFVSFGPESLLAEMMEDPRLCRRYEELRDHMHEDLVWLQGIPDHLWSDLQETLPNCMGEISLREEVLMAATTAYCYIDQKTFRPIRDLPWSLSVGDVCENVRCLCALTEPPREEVANKLWVLNRQGWELPHPAPPSHTKYSVLQKSDHFPWHTAFSPGLPKKSSFIHSPSPNTPKSHPTLSLPSLGRFGVSDGGVPDHLLLDAVKLLSHAEFSTLAVEQAHGSLSQVCRWHPSTMPHMLCMRAFLHQVRPILQPTPARPAIRELMRVRQKHENAQPSRMCGRHMYLRSLMLEMQKQFGRALTQAEKQTIMRNHGRKYDELSLHQKAGYDRLAVREREKQVAIINAELSGASSQIALLQNRDGAQTLSEQGLALWRLQRLSPQDIEKISSRERMHRPKRTHPSNAPCLLQAPEPPPETHRTLLVSIVRPINADPFVDVVPRWAKTLCRLRDLMSNLVLLFHEGERVRACLVVLAFLSPYEIYFLELNIIKLGPKRLRHGETREVDEQAEHFLNVFEPNLKSVLGLFPFKNCESDGIEVVLDVSWDTSGQLVSDEPAVSWGNFADTLPEPPPKEHTRREEGPKPLVDAALLTEHPWLLPDNNIAQQPRPQSAGSRVQKQHDRRTIPDDANMEDLERAWQDFHHQQQVWLSEGGASVNFQTFLRGGRWTKQITGEAVDCIATKAASTTGRRYLEELKLNRMASFAFSRYGRKWATWLALLWCAAHEQWMLLWLENEEELRTFPELDVACLEVDQVMLQEVLKLPQQHHVRTRYDQILRQQPSTKVGSSSGAQKVCVEAKGQTTRANPSRNGNILQSFGGSC